MHQRETGNLGEDFAAKIYVKKGYEILSRNYHSRWGEIDIIAQNSEYLVFIEVKTRAVNSIALARESVDFAKQEKLKLTAQQYLQQNKTDKQPRFDVVEVIQNKGHLIKYSVIENAF